MLEIALAVAVVILMVRIARADDESPVIWGGVTIALCIASLWLPLPMIRLVLAAVATYLLMFAFRIIARK